jgi:hypothetical protein
MAQRATQEVASYLRDGSLWIGQFVAGKGELNFGDDRVDAAHRLASLVCAGQTTSTVETDARFQTWNRAVTPTSMGKTTSISKSDAVVESLKLAA